MTRARILADYVSSGDELALKAPLASPTFTGTTTISGDLVPSTPLSNRNMVINGGMQVAQRSSVAFAHDSTVSGYSEVDRYKLDGGSFGSWDGTLTQHTMSQADLNTTGFSNALKFTTGTAESAIAAGELLYFSHIIEAQNCQHLQYGTANAKTITLSFWVKTSVTGTFSVALYKQDSTARTINGSYTTSGPGWEYKTITFAGDTDSSATIVDDNGPGLYITWNLVAGSTWTSSPNTSWGNYASANWAGLHAQNGIVTTAGATLYLTGVQLEVGSNATPFEHRSYGDELQRCQRYFQVIDQNARIFPGRAYNNSTADASVPMFATTMRSAPSMSQDGTAALSNIFQSDGTLVNPTISSTGFVHASPTGGMVRYNYGGGTLVNGMVNVQTASNSWHFSSEL